MSLFPASGEHLLSALIPHLVLSRDLTAYLGSKAWLFATTTLPRGPCDDTDASDVASSTLPHSVVGGPLYPGVCLDPWLTAAGDPTNKGGSGGDALWAAARLASLLPTVSTATFPPCLFRAMSTLAALAEYLAQRPFTTTMAELIRAVEATPEDPSADLAVTAVGSATAAQLARSPVARVAARWLMCGPRCAHDVPSFRAATLRVTLPGDGEDLIAALPLLAPSVRAVSFRPRGYLPPATAMAVLLRLRGVRHIKLDANTTFKVELLAALRSGLAAGDAHVLAMTRRINEVTTFRRDCDVRCNFVDLAATTEAMADSGLSGALLFPNLTTVRLQERVMQQTAWAAVAALSSIEHLSAWWDDTNRGVSEGTPDTSDGEEDEETHDPREAAIVEALVRTRKTLRHLTLGLVAHRTFVSPGGPLASPAVVEAVAGCPNLRHLVLRKFVITEATGNVFHLLGQLTELRVLELLDTEIDVYDLEDTDVKNAVDVVALPRALSKLEVLVFDRVNLPIPLSFVAAVAAMPCLTKWTCVLTSMCYFRENDALGALPDGFLTSLTALPFPALSSAAVPIPWTPVVAKAPQLRTLKLAPFDPLHGSEREWAPALRDVSFASPCVRLVYSTHGKQDHAWRLLDALQESNLHAVSCALASDPDAVPPKLPRSLRHAQFAGSILQSENLSRVIRAARATTPQGSPLLSLSLLHVLMNGTVEAALSEGGFPHLRSLDMRCDSACATEYGPKLRALFPDAAVTLDTTEPCMMWQLFIWDPRFFAATW